MTVPIQDLPSTVTKVDAIASGQQAYVDKLTEMFNSGIKTIRIFDAPNNQWTEIPLQPFWQIQQDLLIAQQLYSSELNAAKSNAQNLVDAALLDVVVPPMEGFK